MKDVDKYPLWEYAGNKIRLSVGKVKFTGWQWHHRICKRILRKYPELEKLQILIQLPSQMHYDLHSGMKDERFFELYGIDRWELLYNVKRHGRVFDE
jgi:hypothetical protein